VFELNDDQLLVARTVREFVDRDVIPVASEMEHRDEYPDALVETMKTLGLFGLNVPEEYGGHAVDYTTFAIVFEELSRGWMGLAGILGTHLVLCDVLAQYGTEDQKRRFLPRLASGEPRAGICLSEPNAGTDLQAITTVARRDGDAYVIDVEPLNKEYCYAHKVFYVDKQTWNALEYETYDKLGKLWKMNKNSLGMVKLNNGEQAAISAATLRRGSQGIREGR
jgi:hypothetical protein